MKNVNKISGFDDDFLWLFNKLDQAAICLSFDYRIIDFTPIAERLFPASREELLGKHISLLFTPLGLAISFSVDNKNLKIDVIDKSVVDTYKAKKILNLDWKIKPKIASDGKVTGLIVYAERRTDIEYLAQVYKMVTGSDEVPQESIEYYAEDIRSYMENIIASMPGNVYWMDKNCVYLGCNDNAAKFVGLSSRKEAVGITYEDIERKAGWVIGYTKLWKQDDLEVIATGKPKLNIEEKPVLMPDGKEIFYLTNRVPLFDKNKNVIGVLGISIDITDRKLMEQKLQLARDRAENAEKELLVELNKEITGQISGEDRSPVAYVKNVQNYLESIIACMPGNIYWMDRDCVYLGCNDNVAKFIGSISRKEVVGMTYSDMEKRAGWVVGQTASWESDDREVMATGKPKLNIEEKPVLLPNGKEIYYLTSRVPLFDNKNNVIGVVGVSIDISDRKKAEKLQKEKDVAEKTSKLMQMLAGSIAHEIRTPLAIISINTDLLKMTPRFRDVKGEEKNIIENHYNNIKYAINLAAHIVDNILTMLRTMSSKELKENKFRRLYIAEDLKKLVEIYPFLEHEKSLVKVRLGKTKDFVYYGDKVLTQHVLFNLMKNSLYAIKEAEKGEIQITLDESKSHNILRFTDTALGVSKALLPKIFEQFESEKKDGAGLGLAFCKVVMESYGGDISCRSKEGEYTEFTLSFPKKCPG